MSVRKISPTTPGRRHYTSFVQDHLSGTRPYKRLLKATVKKTGGRNNTGKITVRHRGGGHKRRLRRIDFKRNKLNVPGIVKSIEYDPNRSSNIALIVFTDGDKRYIIAPEHLKLGQPVITSETADIKPGNTLPLKNIPVGTPIHNLELKPGKGGQIVRSAGASALIQSKEGDFVAVQLPSKEVRLVKSTCLATIGQVGSSDHQNIQLGKAGRRRHMGWRPSVRGTAQHPGSHPHGGGEGRSGVGLRYPKTPWGKPALGKKTRKTKHSDKYIIKHRHQK
jgi:large subunit ribosomal protein L2